MADIVISPRTRFIIACPSCFSGGPEALHAMGYEAFRAGAEKVYMHYVPHRELRWSSVPKLYAKRYSWSEKHGLETMAGISLQELQPEDILVVPEGLQSLLNFVKCQAAVWHLGWGAGIATTNRNALHIGCGRLIADSLRCYVPANTARLDDYLHRDVYQHALNSPAARDWSLKENLALYNYKSGVILDPLKDKYPELGLTRIGFDEMGHDEILDLMAKAKVYLELSQTFGQDRMPREAVVHGCCVVASKESSFGMHQMCPIPEKWKLSLNRLGPLTVKGIIEDFYERGREYQEDFDAYRDWTTFQEIRFIRDFDSIFKYSER